MFDKLKSKVQSQFNAMAENDLFVVSTDKNELFDVYHAALPEEERQEHNCNCCRTFLNHYGNIVNIKDNEITTIWDFEIKGLYADSVKAMRELIHSKAIVSTFLSTFDKLGTDFNHQRLESGEVIKWTHFFVTLPKSKAIRSSDSLDSIHGQLRATKDVFERSLKELTVESIETVLDLIAQNALYRGKEFEPMLKNFQAHKAAYDKLKKKSKNLYVWNNFKDGGRVRNTAIGTLLVNLSDEMPVEQAVRAFEAMVAPANYKRPTSLVTEKMVEKAQQQIEELGLTTALQRRHSVAEDIPVTNLLFVNRITAAAVGSAFDELKSGLAIAPKNVKAKEISIAEFTDTILPKASSVELLLENGHNFMSLISPVDSDAESMFSWNNGISWTYQNNLTDAIKEKVKKAGGSVDGELRISLEWFNYDDLDLHVVEPGGHEISFRDKRSARGDGFLDVDMNAGGGRSREAVENVAYKNSIPSGTYRVVVHNFAKRENVDLGFNVQIECKSQSNLINLNYAKAVHDREQVEVATFKYSSKEGVTDFKSSLEQSHSSRELNGLHTNKYQKVKMVMYSPNHWGDKSTGNQHIFFILDGAYVDNALRPFFNEYLKSDLQEHRKVFEILGSKLMVKPNDEQLSGVGFSLTQQHSFVVKVNNVVYRISV